MSKIDIGLDPRAGAAQGLAAGAANTLALAPSMPNRLRPRNTHVLTIGDSRVDQGYAVTSGLLSERARGVAAWAKYLTNQRFDHWPSVDHFGRSGYQTQQLVPVLRDALAANSAGTVLMLCSTNDRYYGFTADGNADDLDANGANTDSLHNLALMRDMVLDSGRILIILAELPRSGSNALDATQTARHFQVRKWMQDQATRPGVYVVDSFGPVTDQTAATMTCKTGMFLDDLHQNQMGAYTGFAGLVDVMNQLFPPRNILPVCQADAADATNPRGCLNANPMMLGTSGTINTPATVSGDLASNYTTNCTGTGASVVLSKETDASGLVWQKAVLSGTVTVAGDFYISMADVATTYRATGDVIDTCCAVRLDAGQTGVREIMLQVYDDGATGGAKNRRYMESYDSADVWPTVALSGVMRLDPFTIATNGIIRPRLYVRFSTGTLSATVYLRAFACRKLIA